MLRRADTRSKFCHFKVGIRNLNLFAMWSKRCRWACVVISFERANFPGGQIQLEMSTVQPCSTEVTGFADGSRRRGLDVQWVPDKMTAFSFVVERSVPGLVPDMTWGFLKP